VTGAGGLAVRAEEFRPGGEVLRGDSPEVAVRCAEVFAWLMAGLAGDRLPRRPGPVPGRPCWRRPRGPEAFLGRRPGTPGNVPHRAARRPGRHTGTALI